MKWGALLLAIVAAGCTTFELDFRSLDRGTQTGIDDARSVVVGNATEWEAFWKVHTSTVSEPPPLPDVSFRSERVAGIFLGPKPTSCYGVAIEGVATDRTSSVTTVRYRAFEPTGNETCATVVTFPYHLVAIVRERTEVRFERQG